MKLRRRFHEDQAFMRARAKPRQPIYTNMLLPLSPSIVVNTMREHMVDLGVRIVAPQRTLFCFFRLQIYVSLFSTISYT